LLRDLIRIPSFSKTEDKTADCIAAFFQKHGIPTQRLGNNVWAQSAHWDDAKPVYLLNSHHDTVKPAAGWRRDPFSPALEGENLYGLGSNDAGGCLTALIATFLYFHKQKLRFNLVLLASAEEEISGPGGVSAALPALGRIDAAIVGEPTSLQMAVAEKGLMVLDGVARGQSGHAARNEGINALYLALDDIWNIRNFVFEKTSPLLGNVKATVTQIQSGTQHNVVPDTCTFVVDVRSNACYTNEEIHALLQSRVQSELKARSYRLQSTAISLEHPLVQAGLALGLPYFGSATLSDKALMPFPALKLGCGESARSHTADEFIKVSELKAGIELYIRLLETVRE
jgi:acetylornithine deacetylase